MTDAYLDWGISPATFGQIEAQKGAYYSQIYQYIQTVRKALRDTDNSFSFNNRVNEKYAHLSDAFNLINRKYNLQDGLYKSGLISNLMLTQNRIEVDNMKITLNQAKLEQALSLVNLYQELAGGYKYTYATESLNLSNKKYLNQD
jgi:outer membrane protein TolC